MCKLHSQLSSQFKRSSMRAIFTFLSAIRQLWQFSHLFLYSWMVPTICKWFVNIRILLLEFQCQKKLFPDSNEKQFPVSICLSKEEIIPLRIKYKAIMEGKENGFQTDKLDTLMNIPDNEAYVMSLVISLSINREQSCCSIISLWEWEENQPSSQQT